MQLHRFTASSNHKAITMIQSALGPDALVYSTRCVPEGVEIIAGLPGEQEREEHYPLDKDAIQNALPWQSQIKLESRHQAEPSAEVRLIEKLNTQLQIMNERVEALTNKVSMKLHDGIHIQDDASEAQRNLILYYLTKLGFRGKFCQTFINHHFESRGHSERVTVDGIKKDLRKFIQTHEGDLIESRRICALLGPTGIGKTTTILKLAKRFLSNYGSHSVGIITTDYNDIARKNLLLHYQNIYNIDIEYAENPDELAMVIKSMRNKQLILIDTHGVSQRDTANVTRLCDLMESQGENLTTLVVLPCNVQESILNDIARSFQTSNSDGCILTKQDECISMAPSLSVCSNFGMKIAYICDGQDIDADIHIAETENILSQLMAESV